jgi:hypothetical protein
MKSPDCISAPHMYLCYNTHSNQHASCHARQDAEASTFERARGALNTVLTTVPARTHGPLQKPSSFVKFILAVPSMCFLAPSANCIPRGTVQHSRPLGVARLLW